MLCSRLLFSIVDSNVMPVVLLVAIMLLSTILVVFECGKCDKPQPSTRNIYTYGQPTAGNSVPREKAGIKEVSSRKKRTPSNRTSTSARVDASRKTPVLVSEKADKSRYCMSQKKSIYCEPTQVEVGESVKAKHREEQRSPTLKEKKRASLMARIKTSRMFRSKDAKEQAKLEAVKRELDKISRKRCMTAERSPEEDSDTLKGVTSIENEDEKSNNFAVKTQTDFGAK